MEESEYTLWIGFVTWLTNIAVIIGAVSTVLVCSFVIGYLS